MAIEIKELVIKINVKDDQIRRHTDRDKYLTSSVSEKRIIRECVDQVMEKMNLILER